MKLKKHLNNVALYVVAGGMHIFPKLKYNVVYNGLENFTNSPSTLIVCNHAMEVDPMIIVPTIYFSQGLKKKRPELYFVVREEYFKDGFPSFQKDFHPFLGALLFNYNTRGIMNFINAKPIRKFGIMTAREHLTETRDKIGNERLEDIVNEEIFNKYNIEHLKTLRINDVIKVDCKQGIKRNYLVRIKYNQFLKKVIPLPRFVKDRNLYEIMKNRYKEIIEQQLKVFSELLDNRKTVFIFPEGKTSYGNELSRIGQGYQKIIKGTQKETNVTVLPINISYYPREKGRTRVKVNFGEEFTVDKYSTEKELNNELETKLLSCYNLE